jgi:hypothetical protein
MKEPFPHDIRAVLSAPGKALSIKKIFSASFFLLAGYLVYLIFTYLALLFDGVSLDYIWQSYGVFPIRDFAFDSRIAAIIQYIGIGLALFALSLGIMANAVIHAEELRGDYFFSAFDAIKFSLGRIPTLALGYISLGAFIGFISLLALLIGLIGRVPVIGELFIGVFYIIPIFITLVFTVFIVFVSIAGILLLPVIIGARKDKEVFDSLLQLFSVMIKEPIRFIWYTIITGVTAKIASFIMAYLFYRTIQFSKLLLSAGGGDKIERLFNSAYAMLPLDSPILAFITNIFPGIAFGFNFSRWGYGADKSIGATLLAISFFLLFIIILGYMVSVLAAGLTRGYVVIRRMKDDYLIVDEEPLLSGQDYANPPFKTDDEKS